MINILQNVTNIKSFDKYKMPITLEELKKKLFLVKDKNETWYKVERLDQKNIFLETDPDDTVWDKLAKECGASWDVKLSKNL